MPEVKQPEIYEECSRILKELYGRDATFRDGQYEAIEATLTNLRTLVVQRTGWGKSLVYFLTTKLMRERGDGVTLVVSPLLVLMQNQLEAARKLDLKCDVLNSTVKDRRPDIINAMVRDELDIVFVTPETLFSSDVQSELRNIRIGLFVVDEAHCISDWGHDFRLEYGNLKKVIAELPSNVPLLATTATANNRVIRDLERQFGNDVFLSRGPLTRESLSIQVINMPSKVERYAWILENINRIPGSGIIYCLTTKDCDNLARFLQENGIHAVPYHSKLPDEYCREVEEDFKENKIKALVATIKLGMGYDKDDISFVIHFQLPSNIVSYYQQIGRAGRKLDNAYAILLYGEEDEDILNYFIDHAFPSRKETEEIYQFILDRDGVTIKDLQFGFNVKRQKIEKVLSFLINDGFVRVERNPIRYYATAKRFYYDAEKYNAISNIRRQEMQEMINLTYTDKCLSKYTVRCLNDETAKDCNHCVNCLGEEFFPSTLSGASIDTAKDYLDRITLEIEPRKQWPRNNFGDRVTIRQPNQVGICLSQYGEEGYGEMVRQDKYSGVERFRDELVEKGAEELKNLIIEKDIDYITFVPSLRSDIVRDYAERLAEECGIECLDLLDKHVNKPQKEMENSYYQCKNAFEAFYVKDRYKVPRKVILVDDVVDSRWTLTVCGFKLTECGCEEVYPFALADSSGRGGDGYE
ncbi:RecQ family ATP-dependent DNA helicase [Candidatus Saccharibacteria bacterium]|nr:RecQ family ATP-dependent DNA helicase [Candidatus Saccharibacteria bacterium]